MHVRPDLLPQTLLQVFPSVHALQTCLTPRCFRQALGDEFAPAHACMHVCMYACAIREVRMEAKTASGRKSPALPWPPSPRDSSKKDRKHEEWE